MLDFCQLNRQQQISVQHDSKYNSFHNEYKPKNAVCNMAAIFPTSVCEYDGLLECLTNWGRVTHICVSKLTIIGSDNGLSPGRRQAIIWTNVAILLIGPIRTNFSEILIEMHAFSFKRMCLKMSSAKWRPFFLGLNVLS